MLDADRRVHGTTREAPIDRFLRDEQAALRSSFFGVSDRDLVAHHLAGFPLAIGPADEAAPESMRAAVEEARRSCPKAAISVE